MKTAYVLFGAPGSGKSTFIKKLDENFEISSADNLFTNSNGEYNFEPSRLGKAHEQCLRSYVDNIVLFEDDVVCDNTNTTVVEIAPYIQIPVAYGYDVRPIYVNTPLDKCIERNIHNVPDIVIERMWNQAKELTYNWMAYWPDFTTTEEDNE